MSALAREAADIGATRRNSQHLVVSAAGQLRQMMRVNEEVLQRREQWHEEQQAMEQ